MSADAAEPATSTIQSRPGAVFASADALYLAVVHQRKGRWYSFYSAEKEASEIHKFSIGEKPSDTRYVGSGVVPGHVLNQFAMDEWYGYLRIATTKGRVPDPKAESVVSILAESANGNLARVGAIDKIAPGEDIRCRALRRRPRLRGHLQEDRSAVRDGSLRPGAARPSSAS